MKSKIFVLFVLLTLGAILLVNQISRSRFWDSQRIEKSVKSEIRVGSTKKFVTNYLAKNGIPYRQIHDINSSSNRQQVIKNTGLNSQRMQSLSGVIIGQTREGFTPDDLYNVEIYFFFDKNEKLVITKFFKVWRGI